MNNLRCPRCKEKIKLSAPLTGDSVKCPACEHTFNVPTPQAGPANAGAPERTKAPSHARRGDPPQYFGTMLVACFFAAVGFISLVWGGILVHKSVSKAGIASEGLLIFTSGCLNLALAFGLSRLRDIARNTWRLQE